MPFYSPLRYPGGKRKLANYILAFAHLNDLRGHVYVEPYAGGAAVAAQLLIEQHVPQVWINDIDPLICTFWQVLKNRPEELCRRILDTPLTIEEWDHQRAVQLSSDPEPLDLAFSTFFLNRTNRSGILLGGVIGGREQSGKWKMGTRFNRNNLVNRIETIAHEADRLRVTGMDAADVLKEVEDEQLRAFVFLDPPYFHKTDRRLYRDDYASDDHEALAQLLSRTALPWLLSYDDCPEIRSLYSWADVLPYRLSYTAGRKRRGGELLLSPRHFRRPSATDPARLPASELEELLEALG